MAPVPTVVVPAASGRRPWLPAPAGRRLAQVLAGLVLYGVSTAMIVEARLGVDPWDVFHQGIAAVFDLRLGPVVIATSLVVLLLWIPLRQRPGLGTLLNAVMVGSVYELVAAGIPDRLGLGWRIGLLAGGIVATAFATAIYIGAGLGPGPRDGLMTGIARRGFPVRTVRTAIEVVVLVIGWLLGGTVGVGTVAYAVAIGPLVHPLLPRFVIAVDRAAPSAPR